MSKPEDFNLESLVSTAQQLGPKKRSQFLLLFSPETRDAITRTLEGLEKDSGHPSVEDFRSQSAKTLIIDPTESDDEELTQSGSSVPTDEHLEICLLYTSPSPRDQRGSRMPSSA